MKFFGAICGPGDLLILSANFVAMDKITEGEDMFGVKLLVVLTRDVGFKSSIIVACATFSIFKNSPLTLQTALMESTLSARRLGWFTVTEISVMVSGGYQRLGSHSSLFDVAKPFVEPNVLEILGYGI